MSQALYDDSSPRLSLSPPLSLSHCAWHFFLSPFFLFSVLIVFCSFLPSPPLPPPSSPAYISLKSAVTAETRGLITAPHLTGTPLLSVSLFQGGSHDSCTLDRGRKRITVSEIKAGKDNTHAQAHLPPISLSPTQTLSPSWHIWGLSQWTQKFKATTSFCVFLIVFSEWFIRLCQTLSPRWKELQGW